MPSRNSSPSSETGSARGGDPGRRPGSPPLAEPVSEEGLEFRDGIDLLDGRLVVVGQATEGHPDRTGRAIGLAIFKDDVASAGIAIARLADRADVDHHLAIAEGI